MKYTSLKTLLILVGVALVLLAAPALAQSTADGQFCVRAFEDRNGNGIRDGEPVREPLLEEGISAELTDENGIVIGSALLIDSPTSAQGVICFQNLAPGQYTIIVASADYLATTPDTMTVTLQAGQVPAVLEFGAQPFTGAIQITEITDAVADPLANAERVLWSLLGAIIAAIVMILFGLLVFLLFVRPRIRRIQREHATPAPDAYYQRPPTDETGKYYPPKD